MSGTGQQDKLIRMANQIAGFFATQGDADKAALIAGHLREFWEPRMRGHLQEAVAAGAPELDPLVIEAAARLRAGE